MRRFKKILKWTGLVILFILAGLSATIALRQNIKYERPYPEIAASTDSTIIARGKEIIFGAAHCADCHSPVNADSMLALGQEVPLTGGFKFELPIGNIYSKNISSDTATGIGKYTDKEIARILRYGVHANGTVVYNFMPFQYMSDEDMTAVVSYLRSQKPISNKVSDHELNVLGNAVKAFMVTPVGPEGEVPKSVKRDTSAAYGEYLAVNIANCKGCHTPRTLAGGFEGEPFAGGGVFEEKTGNFTPPNITPHASGRMNGWTLDNFIKRFRMGRLQPGSPMPWPSYGRMSDDDLKAIYNYLQTVPAAPTNVVK